MDLSKPIAYNGLTTGVTTGSGGAPANGVAFQKVTYNNIGVDAFLDKRALQDGLDASDTYLGGRSIDIEAAVMGTSFGHTWDRVQQFCRVFSPRHAFDNAPTLLGFRPMTFFQPTADIVTWPTSTYPSGIPLQLFARPNAAPAFAIERDGAGSPGTDAKGGKVLMRTSLIAKDPRKYVQTAISSTITTTAQSASHRGDCPTFPVITFSLSATGHSALRFFVGGNFIELNVATISSGTYSVDFTEHTITKSDGTLRMDLLAQAEAYNPIQPDDTTAFYMQNATGVSSATITYSEAFF